MENNERKPGESIKQYLNRIKAQKREQRIQEEIDKVKNQEDYGGELDASRLVEFTNTGTISQGTENKKSRKNNHRVDQKSVFGERKFKQNRSLVQRAWNDFTDATHLTSPPKFSLFFQQLLLSQVEHHRICWLVILGIYLQLLILRLWLADPLKVLLK